MSKVKPAVVCYAGDDYWHSNPHSRFHFMHAMHRRGYRVLWVNSLGMNMPKVRTKGFLKKVLQRVRSWSRWLRAAHDDFHVLTPIALPLFGNAFLAKTTDRIIEVQIRLALNILGIRKPLVFASIPSYAMTVMRLPRSGLIYYYSDKYVSYDDISALDAVAERDRLLFEAADAVFCASEMITIELADKRPNVHYLPHAVDFDYFNGSLETDREIPADLAAIAHPRIGYYGSLAENNDQEMVIHAAKEAPSLQFVLIGKVFGDHSKLMALPNVHLLGFKPYSEIANYGKHFDVAFMNWKITEWIRNCSPLKAKEYFSMGLPVVSVPIHELERFYGDIVYFASTPAEFLTQVQKALAEDSPERRNERIDRVRVESWDNRVDQMMEKLGAAMAPR